MTTKQKTKDSSNLFNDYEISICGYSNSGKTTLITKLLQTLTKKFDVGYVKHDAHSFSMDKEGKDTFKAKEAGASSVFINNSEDRAFLDNYKPNSIDEKYMFLDCDFVLIEGYKNSNSPKILVVDENNKILDNLENDKLTNVVAIVGQLDSFTPPKDIPYFHRDDIGSISEFIINYLSMQFKKLPLYGLVLSGGHSTRMKKDKGGISYHGVSQVEYVYNLLSVHCQKTFISCRSDQQNDPHINKFPIIKDEILEIGPMGGIISAMKQFPKSSFIVVACDLPLINEEVISELVDSRNPFKVATCFVNPKKEWPEPLCSIYEPKAYKRFFQYLGLNRFCPRKIIMNSNIKSINPHKKDALTNANTPEDFVLIRNQLEEKHP